MLFFLFSFIISAHAQSHSLLLPVLQQAVREELAGSKSTASIEVSAARAILARKNWSPRILQQSLLLGPLRLPAPILAKSALAWPAVSLQAARFDVLEASDDWFKDDIYCYFIVTNGVIPHARVTETYRGLENGESFHFSVGDRHLFPLTSGTRAPRGTLIVDYGIVESDGDDIQELHRLSGLVAELAVAVYLVLDPLQAAQWGSLRQEVVALTRALTSLNHDDRLVTGTLVLTPETASQLLGRETVATVTKKHQNNHFFDKWRYRLVWRLIKE